MEYKHRNTQPCESQISTEVMKIIAQHIQICFLYYFDTWHMSWKGLDISMRNTFCPPFLRNNLLELVGNSVYFTRQYTLLKHQTHVQIQLVYNAVLILHVARPWATWYPNFIAKACILYMPNLLYTNNMKPKTPRVSVPFVYTTKGAFQKRLRSRNFFSLIYTSLNVWVRYFVWNFKGILSHAAQNILPTRWKGDFNSVLKI